MEKKPKIILEVIGFCLILGLIFFSCISKPGKIPSSVSSIEIATTIEKKELDRWEKLVLAAKSEGRLAISSPMSREISMAISEAFEKKFGIKLEVMSATRGLETIQKLRMERQAGLYTTDIVAMGPGPFVQDLYPLGFLEPIEPALVLPEITDTKVWYEGKLPLIADGHIVQVCKTVNVPITINMEQVKPDEIKSYHDLLNPKWKGRILMDDPSIPGSGGQLATFILYTGIAGGEDFFRELVKQEPTITRDRRLLSEWLARGKFAIALSARRELTKPFIDMGLPIKYITPREGSYLSSGGNTYAFLKKAAHPNAARVFINWILTREGGEVQSRASGYQSTRLDVPTDFLEKDHIRQPGIKYFSGDNDDKFNKTQPQLYKIMADIFAPILK